MTTDTALVAVGENVAMSDDEQTSVPLEEFLARMPMGALNEKMGIELLEVSSERIVATMPVEGNTQPYGLLHGGASVVLAESLGSIGSALHAHPDRVAVGIDINATHHRSATSGTVTGVATPVHLGRTSACFEVVITDERGKRVCTSRITCALVPAERMAR
jgi:1,4-dihydroxy-2-naphthoyl-CoA hydrolase